MKKLALLILVVSSMIVYAGNNQVQIGEEAQFTDVKMTCVSGNSFSLDDLKKDNGLIVIFSCNTCPFVLKWQDRYNNIKSWADQHDVGMVVLNSNYQKRSGNESLEAMKAHADKNNYQFPYLVDKESLIANSLGGQTTPHVFLFDQNFRLAYKGAIDDNYDNAAKVKKAYLKEAVKSLSEGDKIALTETKPVGCSIKRKLD